MAGKHLHVPQGPSNVEILRAAFVMNVRRPEWLEQPCSPIVRNQAANRLTMAAGENCSERSVVMT